MSREFKFRVWIPKKTGGEMEEYPEMTEWDVADNIDFMQQLGKGGVILQYTGLKDKNGTEIFEGDMNKRYNYLYQVIWDSKTASFKNKIVARESDKEAGVWEKEKNVNFYNLENDLISEIIGNVYENPKLIKS